MAARSADSVARHVDPGSIRPRRRDPGLRPRALVVASGVGAVVGRLGGWLFDLAAAGWEVDVAVTAADRAEVRSLTILGAAVVDTDRALATPWERLDADVLAVATDIYRRDNRIRTGVSRTLESAGVRTMLWGPDLPEELADRVAMARHRVSVAGYAFKMAAFAAVGTDTDTGARTETLWAPKAHARNGCGLVGRNLSGPGSVATDRG